MIPNLRNQAMNIKVGDKAPQFTALTDDDQSLSLSELGGKSVVLFFYPKDMTPGCTNEACDFRDSYKKFLDINFEIVGISKDSVKRHKQFKEKFNLPFSLISDEDGSICEAYGVWQEKKNYGRTYMGIVRSTFLIDPEGLVTAIWQNLRVKGHINNVLEKAINL